MIQSPPRTLLEVFESLPEGTLCQLVNNQLIMSPAPTTQHQRTLRTIFKILDAFIVSNKIGEVFFAPIDVFFNSENVYQSDILFVAKDRQLIVGDKINGAPDLIVEILSPGSASLDKIEKKEAYQQFGVKEYWMVNPETKSVIGYQLLNDAYVEIPPAVGIINSRLLTASCSF